MKFKAVGCIYSPDFAATVGPSLAKQRDVRTKRLFLFDMTLLRDISMIMGVGNLLTLNTNMTRHSAHTEDLQ